jgi:hypothetical protein
MTPEEKTKFEKMEQSVEKIHSDVTEIKSALLGNPLSGEKGLTGRIDFLTAKVELQETQIKILIEEKTKNTVYVKLINWLLTVIGVGIIGLLFNYLKSQ